MGRPLIVVLVAVLVGCGSVAREAGDGSGIRAVNRPAPDAFERWARPDESSRTTILCVAAVGGDEAEADCEGSKTWESCAADAEKAETDPACEEYRAQLEESRRAHERWIAELAPAPGTEPRVVAELDVEDGHTVELVAWRTAKNRLCGLARAPSMADWAQQFVGECFGDTSCEEICPGTLVAGERRVLLVGMVAASADAIRVTTDKDRVLLQALDGAPIPDSKLEALIVDLGAEVWRELEVFRDGRSVEKIEIPGMDELWACYDEGPAEDCDQREVELDE